MDAVRDAVRSGWIEGLDNANIFEAIPWAFPSTPMGPYSDLGGFTAIITDGPNKGNTVVFFLGKATETKSWEVFSSMIWKDEKWEPLPVQLPKQP